MFNPISLSTLKAQMLSDMQPIKNYLKFNVQLSRIVDQWDFTVGGATQISKQIIEKNCPVSCHFEKKNWGIFWIYL